MDPQAPTQRGGLGQAYQGGDYVQAPGNGNTQHLLSEDVFKKQFGNQRRVTKPYYRRKTYVCYQLKLLRGPTIAKGYFRNKKKRHAEIRFIDKINSLGLDQDQSYEITCYVTWSPCATCACKLIKFTRKFPNLSLRIFVSRLYYHWFRQNQQGLRQLWASSIPVVVMGYQEFADCWENFADNRGNPFQSWEKLTEYSKGIKRRLQKILEQPLNLNGLEDAMGNLKLGSVDLG
ncbi:DNA dC-_dU-editing enzyme APOBEC-3H isoform X1 [Equus przewalskii]|uniref:single-stranded DNA cytosine deaminase n=2 Tax=Equus TaxID=9789 RepID=C7AGG6_HORSE|nr:DNA dC->dU-editing enzyme APOBEC-3H [Equus caballus]ACT33421.1 APOBEC3Z3 [Equus caballus]